MIFPMVLAGATVTGIKGKQLGNRYRANNKLAKTISNTTDNIYDIALLNLNKNRTIARNKIFSIDKYKREFLNKDLTEFLTLSNKFSNYACNRKRLGQEMINIINFSILDDENSNLSYFLNSEDIKKMNLEDSFIIDNIDINELLNIRPYSLELVSEKNLSKAIDRYNNMKSIIFSLRKLNETMLDYQRNCLIALKYYDEFVKIYRYYLKRMKSIVECSNYIDQNNLGNKFKKILFNQNKINYLKLDYNDRKTLDNIAIMSDIILEAFKYKVANRDGTVNIKLNSKLKSLRVDI